jgi:hypothetical protein
MPRSTFLLLFALPLIAGRAAAQAFEGTVTMTVATSHAGRSNGGTMKTATRGDRTVISMMEGSSAAEMAESEVRTIIDRKANTLTTLVPIAPGMSMPPALTGGVNARGFVMVTPLSSMFGKGDGKLDTLPDVRKLGTSQTIAGVRCDDYEIRERRAAPLHACITTALGPFAYPLSGRGLMGGGGPTSSAWARALGDKPGFPLKVSSDDGSISLQVTAIDRTPVPDSAFAVPAGYVTMPRRGG